MKPRYENGVYRDCKWCYGKGCISCPEEAQAEYDRQFPEGPQPIATFKTDNPQDMENMKQVFGVDVITKAFGPDGNGMEEIMEEEI
jgi:hypothetical protein